VDPRNYRPANLISVPGKVMEKVFLELISSHIRDKKVTGNCQHLFTKGKSCQTNLIPFYNEAGSSVDERRATIWRISTGWKTRLTRTS